MTGYDPILQQNLSDSVCNTTVREPDAIAEFCRIMARAAKEIGNKAWIKSGILPLGKSGQLSETNITHANSSGDLVFNYLGDGKIPLLSTENLINLLSYRKRA